MSSAGKMNMRVGFARRQKPRGDWSFETTKRMVDVAYRAWCKRHGIEPRDAAKHSDCLFTKTPAN